MTPDGKTWTFTIREGARWNDGVPLTAGDVAFTYNYIIDNDLTNWTSYTQGITHATAVDDTTVRFDCSEPKADMLRVYVPIVPEHVWSKVPGEAASVSYPNTPPIVGSGPFTCVEWKKNSFVKMVANKGYWGRAPQIDELYFEYYTNADTMVQDLKAGTIDGAFQILDAQYLQLKTEPGIEARTIATNGFDELAFNCYEGPSRGNPVLKDVKFRQALNWAVDKDEDLRHRLRRSCAAGHHRDHRRLLLRPGLALAAARGRPVRLRPGESQAAARRGRLPGHGRRRHPRG